MLTNGQRAWGGGGGEPGHADWANRLLIFGYKITKFKPRNLSSKREPERDISQLQQALSAALRTFSAHRLLTLDFHVPGTSGSPRETRDNTRTRPSARGGAVISWLIRRPGGNLRGDHAICLIWSTLAFLPSGNGNSFNLFQPCYPSVKYTFWTNLVDILFNTNFGLTLQSFGQLQILDHCRPYLSIWSLGYLYYPRFCSN